MSPNPGSGRPQYRSSRNCRRFSRATRSRCATRRGQAVQPMMSRRNSIHMARIVARALRKRPASCAGVGDCTIVSHRLRCDRIVRAFIKVPDLTDERAAELAKVLTAVDGVVDAEVFAEDAVASVLYDVRVDVPALIAVIKRAGYDARAL